MAALHILTKDSELFSCVAHQAVPGGSNSAGVTWKNVILGAGLNVTVLVEGTGAGQISTAEKAQVIAGDVVEAIFTIHLHSGGTTNAQIGATATEAYNKVADAFKVRYAFYGKTVG